MILCKMYHIGYRHTQELRTGTGTSSLAEEEGTLPGECDLSVLMNYMSYLMKVKFGICQILSGVIR